MSDTVILRGVTKRYRIAGQRKTILDGIDLSLSSGTVTALCGKSGCGKTTLLQLIAGLTRPDQGNILFNERKILTLFDPDGAKYRNRNIGFIFQTFRLLPQESVWNNLMLPLVLKGSIRPSDRERMMGWAERLGLKDHLKQPSALLSGGQKQRVAIARALANDPHLILADEPTANLDEETGQEIENLLQELARDGKCVLWVTHDISRARRMDRFFQMEAGKLSEAQ